MRASGIAFYPWMKLDENKHASKLSNLDRFEPKLNRFIKRHLYMHLIGSMRTIQTIKIHVKPKSNEIGLIDRLLLHLIIC
jgi:hypothetical protein